METLGLQIDDQDPGENNLGTLPAALANRGVVQFIPGNCWGDMWHNEEGVVVNDLELDGFNRNGRTIANWMLRPSRRATSPVRRTSTGPPPLMHPRFTSSAWVTVVEA